jgi:hypothetical protein
VPTFTFTTNQAKDCVTETENQLRDLIATVLSGTYGLDWESSDSVWDEETRSGLKTVRSNEKGRFPNQNLSDRLIDYSEILHLKGLIEKNWTLFEPIFGSKSRTMALFDMLHPLRNALMHGRSILLHQKHLCLGICGEFLLAVENWRKGYTHQVKEYTVLFRFSVYLEEEGEAETQLRARHLAEQWLLDVTKQLGGKLEEKSTSEIEKMYLLKAGGNHIKTSIKWDYKGFDGQRYFRSADISMTSRSLPIINKIVEVSNYPYWYLSWRLKSELDVSIIVSRISELTGETSNEAVGVYTPSGTLTYQNASYRIGQVNDSSIRVGLFRAQQKFDAEVCLVFEDPQKGGFYQAHRLLTVEKALSILYGDLTRTDIHQLLMEACMR